MTALDSLRVIFTQRLQLPPAAVDWLLMLFEATQLFDDVADKDPIKREDLDSVLWATLIAMPSNPFYQANQVQLTTLLASYILKWQAADAAERSKQHDEISFVWRAGYYDVVLGVVLLCHGTTAAHQKAVEVMHMYGEKYEDYIKEFGHARSS